MQPNEGGRTAGDREIAGPSTDLLRGTPYEVLGALGEGGMGEVVEARHRTLGHRVVVKVLRQALAGRNDMRDRMRVEAQALARIRHPNLVMVTDCGETQGERPFVVMERLAGRSLREELVLRPVLPVVEAVEIARQMLHGLHAAHLAGLIHRDVKPDNVFLCATTEGRPLVKVLDFGVAKIAQAGADPRTPLPLVLPTNDGVVLGTPRYFSPEQARGARDLDVRSDVYAVGLVLYEMLAGQGPFDSYVTLDALFRAHATEMPFPPSASRRQPIPEALDRMVMRALHKPREERFADALAFAAALEELMVSRGEAAFMVDSPRPVEPSEPTPRAFAEATTAPVLGIAVSGAPTVTASPVARAASLSLSHEETSPAPTTADDTLAMDAPLLPSLTALLVTPAPAPAPSRPSVLETAPMFEIRLPDRPPQAPVAPAKPASKVPVWLAAAALALTLAAVVIVQLFR